MSENKVYTVIGVMCGTSMDAIDLALVKTDGKEICELLDFTSIDNDDSYKNPVRKVFKQIEIDDNLRLAEKVVTDAHINAINDKGWKADLIGFHGQTITHMPEKRFTWQIGDNQRLADETGIDVVGDMRQADVKAGGQGAPLMPICHRAFLPSEERPVAILNMGGVSNITWIGEEETQILGGDVGPANALLNDYMKEKTGEEFDENGQLAASGKVHQAMVDGWLSHEFFSQNMPKSLDRDPWDVSTAYDLSLEDGAATIAAFTVQSILKSFEKFPSSPKVLYVAGGGRHNKHIMDCLTKDLPCDVKMAEVLGWNGDALEAQGFAYLAVRSLKGLVLTLPTTTGVPKPMTGGKLYKSSASGALRPAINK